MKHPFTLLLGITLIAAPCWGADDLALKTDQDKISYSVGYQIGGDFKRQKVELKSDALVRGIQDAVSEGKPLLSEQEMQTTLIDLKKKIVADQEAMMKEMNQKHREEGKAFLEANAKKEGVVVLPSGVQYKVITAGTGKKPTLADKVTVNYRGTRINGKEFSSSYRDGKPESIALNKVVPGLQEALQMMKEGAKWEIYIPSNLAFGERGPLEGNTVIYDMELVSVEPNTDADKTPAHKK